GGVAGVHGAFAGVSDRHGGGGRNANSKAARTMTITTPTTTFARKTSKRNSSCVSSCRGSHATAATRGHARRVPLAGLPREGRRGGRDRHRPGGLAVGVPTASAMPVGHPGERAVHAGDTS